MAQSTYRVAIIGCGQRAREHMVGLQADPRVRIVALADALEDAALAFGKQFALDAQVYTDYRALLETEHPDVVVATLWPELHLPVFQAAVAAGARAVLSEKPIAATWAECRAMGQLADSSGCLLTFCHQRRFAPGNRQVRALLASGRFGQIQRMDLYSPRHLLDCGTHTVDQALSFNSESPAVWVHGAVDISDTVKWFGVRAEIMATGLVHFENGVQASFRVGDINMDLWGGVRVTGEAGFIEVFWDGQIRRCVVYDEPGWTPPGIVDDPAAPMTGVVRNALDCLETGAEPELSHRKALRASEVLFALYESARTHRRVTLPLTGVDGNPLHDLLKERGVAEL